MKPLLSQEEIIDKGNDVGFAWVPYNGTVEKKKVGSPLQIQLVEKKNKLFGKVESEWKE